MTPASTNWHVTNPPDTTPVHLTNLDSESAVSVAVELCRGRRWTPAERDEILRALIASTSTIHDLDDRDGSECGHPPGDAGRWQVPPIGDIPAMIFCSASCAAEYLATFAQTQVRERRREIEHRIEEAIEADRARMRDGLLVRRDNALDEAERHRSAADLLAGIAHDVGAGRA